jgi:hypothetical protein
LASEKYEGIILDFRTDTKITLRGTGKGFIRETYRKVELNNFL